MLLSISEQALNRIFAVLPYKKPQKQAIEKAQLIAHRGAHDNKGGILENTIEAFDLARDAGCWGIELDIHATKDNVLVVNHDATLKRLWGHDVAIMDLSDAELRALEPRIPRLLEVVARYKGILHFFIELKVSLKQDDALVQCLNGLTPISDYHIMSLQPALFSSLIHFPKSVLVLVSLHNNVHAFCQLSIKEGYGGVTGSYLLLTDNKLQRLQEAQQAYGVGFVNSKRSLHRELNRGVRWIFTNEALAMGAYLKELLA